MIETYEVVVLVVCLVASGFYSASEAVLLSIGHDRAKQLLGEGGAKAGAMKFLLDKPNEILSTILIGNNIANILLASLNTTIATRIFASDAVGISVGITTIAILIFGEIIPKTFARNHAEGLSLFVIRLLRISYWFLYPVVVIVTWITNTVLGDRASISGRLVTKNDIEYMLNKAEKEKSMDSKQLDLLNSILEFPTIKVKDIMVPRKEIKFIEKNLSFSEILALVEVDKHSRYPVTDGELEDIVGFLHVKDLAFYRGEKKNLFKIEEILKDPFYVYQHMKIQAVFDHMNRKKIHMALVKDENGVVVGVITLEDIMEEIFGEIQDEHDDDEIPEEIKIDLEAGLLVEGGISLRDLYNEFEIKIPLNDNYSTLAGFILDMLGNNFPEEGQIIVWEGLSFELLSVDDFEIREIRIKATDSEKHLFSKIEAKEASIENGSSQKKNLHPA